MSGEDKLAAVSTDFGDQIDSRFSAQASEASLAEAIIEAQKERQGPQETRPMSEYLKG